MVVSSTQIRVGRRGIGRDDGAGRFGIAAVSLK
jgi:hypothetical protein